ncbi:hypothetical protein, partial [Escherichia coli]|uniref:hypothetical protein n=1 Tax=Escherichia coli TaxID=562 RepID=UPI0035E3ED66
MGNFTCISESTFSHSKGKIALQAPLSASSASFNIGCLNARLGGVKNHPPTLVAHKRQAKQQNKKSKKKK